MFLKSLNWTLQQQFWWMAGNMVFVDLLRYSNNSVFDAYQIMQTEHAYSANSYWKHQNQLIVSLIFRIYLYSYWLAADRSEQPTAWFIYSVHRDNFRARSLVSFCCFSCGLPSCDTPTPSWFHLNEDPHSWTAPHVSHYRGTNQTRVIFYSQHTSLHFNSNKMRRRESWGKTEGCAEERKCERDESVVVSTPPSVGVWMGLPTPLCRGFFPSPAACVLITPSRLQQTYTVFREHWS